MDAMIQSFVENRDRLLIEMDEGKIRKFYRSLNVRLPDDPETFWRAIHKARTGAATLPINIRRESAAWLRERGSSTFDDGELA